MLRERESCRRKQRGLKSKHEVASDFQIQFDRFANICQRVLDGSSFGLAAFEFRAPGVKAVLVFLDQYTGFASHRFSLLLPGGAWTPRAILVERPIVEFGSPMGNWSDATSRRAFSVAAK